jgi:hypothetical protein
MKKSISSRYVVPVFLFILIVTTNCSQKDTIKQNEATRQDVLPTKALTKVDDYNSLTFGQIRLFEVGTQKYCYSQMNSSNKAKIWMERISYISSLYKSSIKKSKILELKTFISPELFSTKKPGNFEITINKWIGDNKEIFGLENLRLILNTMSELRIKDTKNENLSEIAYAAALCPPRCGSDPCPTCCTCSSESSWCVSVPCTAGGCQVTNGGCGTFWSYSCNGWCGFDPSK